MGTVNCFGKSNQKKEIDNQIILINDNQSDKSDIGTNCEKDNRLQYAPNIQRIDFKKIKSNFENSMKNQAEFITDKSFEEILEKTNINKIDFPNEIENKNEYNSFIAPPLRFNNGQIYKGSWNIKNQRNGFGISINPNGLIYKGLWANDKIGNYGLIQVQVLDENQNIINIYQNNMYNNKNELNLYEQKNQKIYSFENNYSNNNEYE